MPVHGLPKARSAWEPQKWPQGEEQRKLLCNPAEGVEAHKDAALCSTCMHLSHEFMLGNIDLCSGEGIVQIQKFDPSQPIQRS
jgi:hypothetical protein